MKKSCRRFGMGVLLLLGSGSGCSLEETVFDGFYGGISDAISTVITTLLLSGTAVG